MSLLAVIELLRAGTQSLLCCCMVPDFLTNFTFVFFGANKETFCHHHGLKQTTDKYQKIEN